MIDTLVPLLINYVTWGIISWCLMSQLSPQSSTINKEGDANPQNVVVTLDSGSRPGLSKHSVNVFFS